MELGFWKVYFSDGMSLAEKQADYWDNVPDKIINKVEIFIVGGKVLTFEHFLKICVARTGLSVFGDDGSLHVGYTITEIKLGALVYHVTSITGDSYNTVSYKLSELTMSEQCFRRGQSFLKL